MGDSPVRSTGLSSMEEAFYGPEARWVAPASQEEIAEIMKEAERSGSAVVPSGHGAHAYLGNPPPEGSCVVSLCRLRKVLHYEPDDFTVSVQAGMAIEDLRRIVGERGQELPADVPAGTPGTVGGFVSAAQPGPRLGSVGPLRAHIAGVQGLRGGASVYHAGGRVLKNAVGYDVTKFVAGALGTAGFLLEVHWKLQPIPARRTAGLASLPFGTRAWELVRNLRKLQPAALWKLSAEAVSELRRREFLDGSSSHAVLWVLEGNPIAVEWQQQAARACLAQASVDASRELPSEGAESLLDFLSKLSCPGATPPQDLGVVRLAPLPTQAKSVEEAVLTAFGEIEDLRASVAADGLTGLITVRWSGSPPRIGTPLPVLRKIAMDSRIGGKLLYLPPRQRRSQEYLLADDPSMEVAARLLGAFDPAGIFTPGRIFRRRGAEGARGSHQVLL